MANDTSNLPEGSEKEQAFMFRLTNWFDGIYIRKDGGQKYINAAVVGFIVLILTAFVGTLTAVFTGVIHP